MLEVGFADIDCRRRGKDRMGWKETAMLELGESNAGPIPLSAVPPPLTKEKLKETGMETRRYWRNGCAAVATQFVGQS